MIEISYSAFQSLYDFSPLVSEMTDLGLDTDLVSPDTEVTCDLTTNGDMDQLSREIEKERCVHVWY